MSYEALKTEARSHGLFIMGAMHPDTGTLILLGTGEGFWPIFTSSVEYEDDQPDPLDRWSKRVIGDMAAKHNAECHFPSDGPPYPPFITWALNSERFHSSPINMLVHDQAGLMVSLRGALHIPERLTIPGASAESPCDKCTDQPCRTACPVDALNGSYDVPACKAWIASPKGASCLTGGCLARRACPLSQSHGRLAEQSAFHMEAFLNS